MGFLTKLKMKRHAVIFRLGDLWAEIEKMVLAKIC